jgi:hypothetical protein
VKNWDNVLKSIGLALLVAAAFAIVMAVAGCAPSGPVKTPQQVWIDAHPTHQGPNGECIEFDDEPCDDDPFDLDDWYESTHKTPAVKKQSPRPMLTANQPKATPKPKTTRR